MLYVILACQCLTILVLWGLLVVHNRDWLTRYVEREDELDKRFKLLQDHFDILSSGFQAHVDILAKRLEPKPEPELEYPAGTAFLPGEVGEAEMEKMIRQSEDRSVGPRPTRFSSRPSDSSDSRSRREPSTRPVRRSGTG